MSLLPSVIIKFVNPPSLAIVPSTTKPPNLILSSLSSSIFQKLKDGFKVYNHYMNYNLIKSLYLLISLSINYLKKS